MSLGIVFAKLAFGQFQQLEPWLQEAVLDLIDAAASDPVGKLRNIGIQTQQVIDLKVEHGGGVFYVFVTVTADDAAQLLRVLKIGTHVATTGSGRS